MIDPVSLIALIGLGITGATTLGKLIPTSAEAEQRKRIKELQNLEAKGQLGLTAQQRADLTALGMEPLQAKERELRARAGETIGLQEVGAGGTILRQQATEDAIRQASKDIGLAVAQMDREEAARQKQELEGLKQQRLALQQQTKEDLITGIQDVAVGAANVAAQTQRAKQEGLLLGNEKALRQAIVADLQSDDAYITTGATKKFSPLFAQRLIEQGFNPGIIAVLETIPQDELINFFNRPIVQNPYGYGSMAPAGNPYQTLINRGIQ